MMENLKPCPFCGKPVNIYYSSATKEYYVVHVDEQRSDCMVLMPLSINHNRKLLRLVDAYALWNERAEYADGEAKNDEVPAGGAAEAVHGVWLRMSSDTEEDGPSDKIVCSECLVEAPYYTKSVKGKQERTAYCPNCGAKMDA